MTLAVGVKYPWGDLKRLIGPNNCTPEAIVLASDSRWTLLGPHLPNVARHKDVGTKLFQLGNDVGAVYAGVSEVGERCLSSLRKRLSRANRPSSQNSMQLAQQTFRYLWEDYLNSEDSKRICPEYRCLYILIGACSKAGIAELYRFSSEQDFKAEVSSAPYAIGIKERAERLLKALEYEMRERVDSELSLRSRYMDALAALSNLRSVPSTFIKPSDVAFIVGHYLNAVIRSGEDDRIGGKIQCAIISRGGFSVFPMSYSTDPTNAGGWTEVTAQPSELRTWTGTFGCYSIADFCR